MIPVNIFDLLTPIRRVGLAYWIADDGSWNKVNKYVTLCTDSFTLVEVQQLIEILNTKFNLRCYKTKSGNNFRIIIPSYSIPTYRKGENYCLRISLQWWNIKLVCNCAFSSFLSRCITQLGFYPSSMGEKESKYICDFTSLDF